MPDIQDLTTTPPPASKSVLLFWAPWHDPSSPKGSISKIYSTLASSTSGIRFYRVEAEAVPELSLKYAVTVVPTFVLLSETGTVVEKIEGGDDVARVTSAVNALSSSAAPPPTPSSGPASSDGSEQQQKQDGQSTPADELNVRLKSLISSSEVILFMKGSPTAPRCGFSRQAVELLTSSDIPFGSFDILTDNEVRQGLKAYSDWPTYPQLYVRGELIGGLDILKEMAEEGDLAEQLEVKTEKVPTLEERLKKLVNRHRIMLFLKGLPSAPRCGFSRQIVEILDSEKVAYDSFNILEDEEVRQGLKKYSDWPTYPQLYVDGDLIGGLDIVKEMQESDDLTDLLKG